MIHSPSESKRDRRDLSTATQDQDNEPENIESGVLDGITVNRNPTIDNEVSNRKYVVDEINKNTIFIFNQSLQNYFKVTVANNDYNFTGDDRKKITDTTIIKARFVEDFFYHCG